MWNSPDPDYAQKVYLIARQVPAGKVTTYGQIATMIPPLPNQDFEQHRSLGARWVGAAMNAAPDDVPWQRVINSQGKISMSGATGDRQRQLLESEGIVFDRTGKVDLGEVGWEGPDDAWLDEHDFLPPDQFPKKPRQQSMF